MDIPAPNGNGKRCKATNCGTTKYDLGENSRGINKARSNRPCKYFASGYCRRGNSCWYSHYYQKPYNSNNYKTCDRIKCKDSGVYIAPGREGLKWSGTVSGPNVAAASSTQYDPVTDSLDLIKTIISEEEAKTALKLELARTGDLVGLHWTDCNDVELMAANVERHQSSEEEQFPDCTDERLNILKDEEMTERKDGSKVANIEGDVKADESEKITSGKLELPRTSDLVGVGLHGTDCNDVELMATNVERHQASEEQFPDCTDERQNILKDGEMTERKEGSKVANIEGDIKADESEKITNGKGLRAFKFALTEFVKELLCPTWNRQKIDKEAYKTIAKKVVKKVIFSVQSIHVPRTQKDINNYLAVSKPKISKLVQAYIEIVEKGKANVA